MSPLLSRVAGGLALAHVTLMLTGLMVQSPPSMVEGRRGIREFYADRDAGEVLTGGVIEILGFLCLVPVLVFLGPALQGRTVLGRWASATAVTAGVAYVSLTLGAGFAPGAASLWAAQQGVDLGVALLLNDIRNMAYFASLAVLGVHAIATAAAALSGGHASRWLGWGGLATGVILVAAVPGAAAGLQDYATLLWLVWWGGIATLLLRSAVGARDVAPRPVVVRQP